MAAKKILVIDDSATIRKLVDNHLSPVGYQVFLAGDAEEGLRMAAETLPDLILLDHQLPGTTGYEVCRKLVAAENLATIPVVVSSTLRKRAYAEYTELDNVVDMLPKPYTEELLRTTIANALETAAMVVSSQSRGTAVPEVIRSIDDAAFSGTFSTFSLREILDFLNNGCKAGCLEVEAHRQRFSIYLSNGHVQGVAASGLDDGQVATIVESLPPAIENLSPLVRMTLMRGGCTEVDGFIQLLDRKVLDPRLMSRLLQYQSAMLIKLAFGAPLKLFRFEAGRKPSDLFQKLPLDTSLLALLVEGALHEPESESRPFPDHSVFVRRTIRGQNLDRAGLSAKHMKIMGLLTEPRGIPQLAEQLGWDEQEVCRVLRGFVDADLVQIDSAAQGEIVVYVTDAAAAHQMRAKLGENLHGCAVRFAKDRLTLQLLMRRQLPNYLLFDADSRDVCDHLGELAPTVPSFESIHCIALSARADSQAVLDGLTSCLPSPAAAVLPTWFTLATLTTTLRSIAEVPVAI